MRENLSTLGRNGEVYMSIWLFGGRVSSERRKKIMKIKKSTEKIKKSRNQIKNHYYIGKR